MSSVSPPSRSSEPEPSRSGFHWLGAAFYGAVFLAGAVLIFFLTLTPGPEPMVSSVAAPSTPIAPIASDKPVAGVVPPPAPVVPDSTAMPMLPLTYPPTRVDDDYDTFFKTRVDDPYRWLENGASPEVQDWLKAEDSLARSYLDALPGRDFLKKRYQQLLYIDTMSAPSRSGDRFLYMKRGRHEEKSVLYWRSATDAYAAENVLIDPNVGKANASLGSWVPSYDGKLVAYALNPNNADEATLYVRNVGNGKDVPGEVIEGAKYADLSWMADNSGFVYTWLPPADPKHVADRPGLAVVRYHKLGTDPKNDPVLHPKSGDPTKFVGAFISRDGKWIFYVQQNGWDRNDLYYQALKGQPTAALARNWNSIIAGNKYRYSLTAWKGQGYLLTNEGAPRYRLFKVSLDDPRRSKWKEIVPESSTAVLRGVDIVGDHLVLDELQQITSQVEIRTLDGKPIRKLDLPGLGSVVELSGEPDHDELYFGYDSFTQPLEIFQTSVSSPDQKLWDKIEVPVDPSDYVVEQKFFASKDGTQIPMFIVHRADIKMDGSTPFLMTGYGGFGISETPYFFPGVYPWLEAGGGFAVVNLRGGGEYGEQWHQDGMLLKKQNVFDDCIGAAEYLIKEGYTKPERLALRGASNGGLLVGAVLTQRPDLFRAVVCEVPLLDMVRYDQFGSGKTWVSEYGSPKDAAQFKALYAYSPYHHVVKGTAYPSVLICTADDDDRVDPMHARKMAAALQAATSSPNPILLRVEAHSGHGGSDQVKKMVDYGTDIWGFLIHELGAETPGEPPKPDASN